MRTTARRRDGGQPLRDAMTAASLGLEALADATRRADPDGKGVSFQLIAFLATSRTWARETTTVRSAGLIEDALSVPHGTLFEQVDMFAPGDPEPSWAEL